MAWGRDLFLDEAQFCVRCLADSYKHLYFRVKSYEFIIFLLHEINWIERVSHEMSRFHVEYLPYKPRLKKKLRPKMWSEHATSFSLRIYQQLTISVAYWSVSDRRAHKLPTERKIFMNEKALLTLIAVNKIPHHLSKLQRKNVAVRVNVCPKHTIRVDLQHGQ